MKWCFLVSEPVFFKEFWWEIAKQVMPTGDECLVLIDGKIAEYGKIPNPPQQVKFFSKVDWCAEYYDPGKNNFKNLFWRALFPDFTRYKPLTFNYKSSVEIVSQLYQFIDFVIKSEKPDVIISGSPSNLFEQVAYHLSEENKITYIGLMESRLGEGRVDVCDLEHTDSRLEPTFGQLKETDISESEREFTRDFISAFLSHKELIYYMKEDKRIYSSNTEFFRYCLKKLKRLNEKKGILLKYLRSRKRFKKFDYKSEILFKYLIQSPGRDIIRKARIFSQKSMFQSLNGDDSFYLYPLHFQPEFTSSVLATYYADQLATINNIAFALPFPHKLYVKEHPSSRGTRPDEFYSKMKKIPNVVLISAEENMENLIKRSLGVITLTGTAGLEAAISGKPAYVLGKVFYTFHPLCRKINNFDDLREKLQSDLTSKPDIADLAAVNLRFVTSYLRNTLVGNIVAGGSSRDTNDYKAIFLGIRDVVAAKK